MTRRKKSRKATRSPTDVDRVVGMNLRNLRIERDLTLAELSQALGISHQQLQKYETGTNRLSAGMIANVAELLGILPETLFETDARNKRDGKTPEASERDRLRRQCRYVVNQTDSVEALKEMARVLKALATGS